ncbi:MAG: ATP-dependent helicase [Armatimonadetes bacterium CG_4_10_14_3_um_filter_66_18]|nr:DEAD/DEAH box helicase [Armatimonadota bacterium]OIO95570.1 MAG: hypothetical protein AUJ96_26490 [Armatimonadetes bacterium CG2_30_66_41]PIU95124.1 MAG: ATP-dependent helicase [Armatimonadetes bacterium CG06_land_8_20_14_3_00_66_21]PIX41427.1 MAG: ATP-dependent helicase [Armatimonadetes bacterium CG_4_8_14_3_um_filter_66_20]PIY40204.1 MAG: ATP-dependent helicase [Armatimonadetes bacterium CG_4_10_14_3_um_filter_66_18]PIZ30260.1 MAG: ATP-dependent helicase [Armatimonadetes bacterium CG_4_10
MDVDRFLNAIQYDRDYRRQIVHVHRIPQKEAEFGTLRDPLHPLVQVALEAQGIERLYVHQVEAVEAIRRGEQVVVVTPTASGKTLCYHLPILERVAQDSRLKAFFLYPTKALAQDQLRGLLRFKELSPNLAFGAGTYDGDTPTATRTKLRDKANFILTNPDMLHSGILPNHARWGEFFTNLKYVVIDEVHTYRGVFGSNVSNVLRRLNRICAHYGSKPQFVCSSATIANPVELAEGLTGQMMTLVDHDGSPRGAKAFVLWNPPLIEDESMERRSPNVEAEQLMVSLVRDGIQTITFVRARVLAELIYRYCLEHLQRHGPRLANAIRAYRAGYLAEDRRKIERQLFSGELLGVVTTSALELGIDIGSLDACLLVGYPGTVASTWQRAGRVGRGEEEALVVLIAHNNPIDQYLVQHPTYFFGQTHENAIIDADNPHIMVGHLRCAASELPVERDDLKTFGEYAPAVIEILEDDRQVARQGERWVWTRRGGYPAGDINLRNMGDNTYTIVDETQGNQVIGSVDEISAFTQLHTEAVYLHNAETYFVNRLDLTQRVAYVQKADVDYYTQAVTEPNIRIDETELERDWRLSKLGFGQVTVTETVLMFRKIKFHSLDSIGFGNLDLPPIELETTALWIIPPLKTLNRVRDFKRIPAEGMLGIANVASLVVGLYVLCDSGDLGSVVDSSNTGSPTLFIYDKYPGGLGFAQKATDLVEEIMAASLELISECQCEDGCPSCVGLAHRTYTYHDADAEQRERIPDKEAALIILHEMLEREPYVPKPLKESAAEAAPGTVAEVPPPVKRLPENVELKLRKRLQGMKAKR